MRVIRCEQCSPGHHWVWSEPEPDPHRFWHRHWERGVPASAEVGAETVVPVTLRDPAPVRRLAHELGRLLQRETGQDRAVWPRPNSTDCPRADEPQGRLAHLTLVERRAVAMVVSQVGWHWGLLDPYGRGRELTAPTRAPSVVAIFTCAAHRRQGIARRLVAAAAASWGCAPSELGWERPFTDSGLALARSFTPEVRVA